MWVNDDIETKMNSAIIYRGHVYCISERAGGQLMCVDLQTGKTVWSESSFAQYGTLMMANGKLVILDEDLLFVRFIPAELSLSESDINLLAQQIVRGDDHVTVQDLADRIVKARVAIVLALKKICRVGRDPSQASATGGSASSAAVE